MRLLLLIYVSGGAARLLQSHSNDSLTVGGSHCSKPIPSKSAYDHKVTPLPHPLRLIVEYCLHCSPPFLSVAHHFIYSPSPVSCSRCFQGAWGQLMSDQRWLFFCQGETKRPAHTATLWTGGLCNFYYSLLPFSSIHSVPGAPSHASAGNVASKRHHPQQKLGDHSLQREYSPIPSSQFPHFHVDVCGGSGSAGLLFERHPGGICWGPEVRSGIVYIPINKGVFHQVTLLGTIGN